MESVDPRTMHVLIRDKETLTWQDETWKVAKARRDGNRIVVTYTTSGKEFPYGEERARLYDQVERRTVDALDDVRIGGKRRTNVEIIWTLRRSDHPRDPRYTLAYRTADGTLKLHRYGHDEVRVTYATAEDRHNAATLNYVREEVRAQAGRAGAALDPTAQYPRWVSGEKMPPEAILANVWEWLAQAPRGSALEAFLAGTSATKTGASDHLIMPFPSNIDQRNAIRAALTHQLSIIDGPPGTGKTQTILNLIASLIAQGKTVGVVAGANSAVDNVVDKLTEEGYGFLVANLGRTKRVKEFHQREGVLEQRREAWARKASAASLDAPAGTDEAALRVEEDRLVTLWEDARDIPKIRAQLTAAQRERCLFEEKIQESRRPIADISHLAISRCRSGVIGDLLALRRRALAPLAPPPSLAARRGRGAVPGASLSGCVATLRTAP